jgi:hypothetical protein
MRFRVNWKKFATRLAFVYAVTFAVMFLGGCSAAFLGAISGLLPGLAAAIEAAVTFVASLEGKTVSPTLNTKVQQWGTNIAGLISNLQTIIAAAKGATATTVISQIQAVLQSILSNMSSILSDFNVTDSATVSKFTSLVGLGVALVQTILGLIPIAQATMARASVTAEQLKAEDSEATTHIKAAHKGMQEAYKVIRNTATTNGDVNTALNTLATSLP